MQTKVAEGALIQLRAWLAQRDLPEDGRLPPERELIEILGVTRGELRKALAALENNGELWRHVGKGTFIGVKPIDEPTNVSLVAEKSNPLDVTRARILIEQCSIYWSTKQYTRGSPLLLGIQMRFQLTCSRN